MESDFCNNASFQQEASQGQHGHQRGGIVKLRLTAVFDAQHGGFETGWSAISLGSIDELFVNLTMPPRGGLSGGPAPSGQRAQCRGLGETPVTRD